MWWIRDFLYQPAGRIVAAVIAVVVLGFGGYLVLNSSGSDDSGTAVDQAAPQNTPGGALAGSPLLSPGAQSCTSALLVMDSVIDSSGSLDRLPADELANFANVLATARQVCTYRELTTFDNNRVVPWTGGFGIEQIDPGSRIVEEASS